MKYRVLILGDGKLATELHRQTDWNYISRKKDDINFFYPQTYENFIVSDEYDQILNCIGYTKTYENERQLNWNANYVGVINLVNMCNKYNKKIIHISTDYIYANTAENSSEDDIPVHFKSWYSYTKLLADGYVQAMARDYLLLRTTFKPRPFPWKTAWNDIVGNFDYVDVIAKLITKLIEKNSQGVYNVGTESKTYYDLAIQTVPDCVKDDTNAFNHPKNVTMNLSKLNNKLNEI